MKDCLQKNTTKITVELPARAFPYPALRNLTYSVCKVFVELPDKLIQRMELIIDELCNNAAEHGSTANDIIAIHFEITPNKSISVTVEDEGRGKNFKVKDILDHIEKHQKMGANDVLQNTTVRGRGLAHIVTKWAHEWGVTKNKKGGMSFRVKINKD